LRGLRRFCNLGGDENLNGDSHDVNSLLRSIAFHCK
jgi:hypothetical protein